MPRKKVIPEKEIAIPEIKGFKGFDKDFKCKDHQYEVCKTYELPDGQEPKCCEQGFHFCENPGDLFDYYGPANSKYAEVSSTGKTDKQKDGDSKVCTSKIHIHSEISLSALIQASVKFILDKVNWKDNKVSNTGYRSAATKNGQMSESPNTGIRRSCTRRAKCRY